jgi:hypothetical protein
MGGEVGPDLLDGGKSQLGKEQRETGGVDGIGRLLKRHQFDGDVGNGGEIRRKAPTEAIEIGQSAGIIPGTRRE